MTAAAAPLPVLWEPHAGPQTRFLASSAFEALYGGAAGGGKSQALVFGALDQIEVPKYRGIILRRTFPELAELIDLSLQSFDKVSDGWGFGSYNEQKKRWKWPKGAVVEFGYAETYRDVLQYQGDAFQYVGWDELGQIPEERSWTYMMSRVRRTHPAQRLMMRASANPGGAGHFWLNKRFITVCPPSGTATYVPNPDGIGGHTRAFFLALLKDNPTMMSNDPAYGERLRNLPELEYKWLALGDWGAGAGLAFPELAQEARYFVEPFEIPHHWYCWASFDWGYNHPYRLGLYAQNEDGVAFKLDTIGGRGQQPPAIAERYFGMVERAGLDPGRVQRIVAGHDVWADVKARSENIPTLAEQFRVLEMGMKQANISRIAGVQNMRRYFAGDPPKFRMFDTPGNRKCFEVLASRISDPDDVEDVWKVDADEHGQGGDDDYDECVPADTQVRTDSGWRRIADMVGTVGKCLTPIGWKGYNAVRETRLRALTFTARDDRGHIVTATPNHPVLTVRGWVRFADLRIGDEWIIVAASDDCQPDRADVSGAMLLADSVEPQRPSGRVLSAPDALAAPRGVCGELRADSCQASSPSPRWESGEQRTRESGSFAAESAQCATRLARAEGATAPAPSRGDDPEVEGVASVSGRAGVASPTGCENHGEASEGWARVRAVRHIVRNHAAARSLLPRELQDAGTDAPACWVARIIEITEGQTCAVYNLEVEDAHCYAVNGGVVVHNCRYGLAARPIKTVPLPKKQAATAFDADVLKREAAKFRQVVTPSMQTIRDGLFSGGSQ